MGNPIRRFDPSREDERPAEVVLGTRRIGEAEGCPAAVRECGDKAGLVADLTQQVGGRGGILESGVVVARVELEQSEVHDRVGVQGASDSARPRLGESHTLPLVIVIAVVGLVAGE